MIQGHEGIRDAYRDSQTASEYIDRRFREPLGAMLHRRQVAMLRAVIARVQAERVLEIAPGPARVTADVSATLKRPGTLLDASPQMLAEARRRLDESGCAHWRFVQGDAFNLPFSGPFDLIYSFRLIRHFDGHDRGRLYAQIARLLRPGGVLVFDAVNVAVAKPMQERPDGACNHYDAMLSPADLDRELKQAGLHLLDLFDVQRRYAILHQIQVLVAPRSRHLASTMMRLIDAVPGGEPLEWVVACERI